MSSWDDSGYHISDPKHETNAGAGRGASELWLVKPPRYTIARPLEPRQGTAVTATEAGVTPGEAPRVAPSAEGGRAPIRMQPKHLRRFWKKVEINPATECWEWTGAKNKPGYGQLRLGPTNLRLAHRLSYEHFVGAIGDGLQIDHLCRNPGCVNPEHLEPVVQSVNMLRAFDAKTHCLHGHERTPQNIYVSPKGQRRCWECIRERSRKIGARRRALRAAREQALREEATPPPRFSIAFDFPEGGGPYFPVQIGGGAGYTTDLSAAETFGDEQAAEWFLESNYGPMTAQWGVVVEVGQ